MRTTIDIADDALAAAKELARAQNTSAGQVVSRLLRQALAGSQNGGAAAPAIQAGFRSLASRGGMVTHDIVNALRDHEGV